MHSLAVEHTATMCVQFREKQKKALSQMQRVGLKTNKGASTKVDRQLRIDPSLDSYSQKVKAKTIGLCRIENANDSNALDSTCTNCHIGKQAQARMAVKM